MEHVVERIAAVVLALLVSGAGPHVPEPGPAPAAGATVILHGDSMVPRDQYLREVQAAGYRIVDRTVVASNLCGTMAREHPYWHDILTEIEQGEGDALVLQYSHPSNYLERCGGPAADVVVDPSDPAKPLRTTIEAWARAAARSGTHLFLVGTPGARVKPGDPATSFHLGMDRLDAAYRTMAARYPGQVTFVDARPVFEDASGRFAPSRPCLPVERTGGCGPDGSIRVRTDDGVHLHCAGDERPFRCGDSPGGTRYAWLVVNALNAWFARHPVG